MSDEITITRKKRYFVCYGPDAVELYWATAPETELTVFRHRERIQFKVRQLKRLIPVIEKRCQRKIIIH